MYLCKIMYFRFLIMAVFSTLCAGSSRKNPGPRFPPTKGEVWPKPQSQHTNNTYYLFVPTQFNFSVIDNTCDILQRAIERYSFTLKSYANIARWWQEITLKQKSNDTTGISTNNKNINVLHVDLHSPCDKKPYMGMDENYKLSVSQISYLRSNSIWGVLRGLESFSHLFYLTDDYTEVRINSTKISDYPRYQHRGLLLDTSRHFISLHNILKTLNAMSMNKLNVFHWHIVDDASFPYQSERFPDLSAKGAYHPSMIYSKADIEAVIQYATERGIRVVPEFDVPGHTRSWGKSFPSILTKCYNGKKVVGLGPMDPTNNDTYTILKDLFTEVQAIFPDKYFHLGGDAVDLKCWSSNPDLKKYMKKHHFKIQQLRGIFIKNVLSLLKSECSAIVSQEVYDKKVPLCKDVLVQVWKDYSMDKVIKILRSGHKLLISSSWYLDILKRGGDWQSFYAAADPRDVMKGKVDKSLLSNIVGGEACMWGEVVDDSNVISRVWPRASAVAEHLWSSSISKSSNLLEKAIHRLEEHYCRMKRRGVDAQPPNGPGVCVTLSQEPVNVDIDL